MAGKHRKKVTRTRLSFFGAAAAVVAGGVLFVNAYGSAEANDYMPLALSPAEAGPPLSRQQAVFSQTISVTPVAEQVHVARADESQVNHVVTVAKTASLSLGSARGRTSHARPEVEGASGRAGGSRRSGHGDHDSNDRSHSGHGDDHGHSSHDHGDSDHGGHGGSHDGSHGGHGDSGGHDGGSHDGSGSHGDGGHGDGGHSSGGGSHGR